MVNYQFLMSNAQGSSVITDPVLLIDDWPLTIGRCQVPSFLEGNPPPRFSISS
jgi:hypothetical protein